MYTLADGWPVFLHCNKCHHTILTREWLKRCYICPNCGYITPLPYPEWLRLLVDKSDTRSNSIAFYELWPKIEAINPLQMPDFDEKLMQIKRKTGMLCGIVSGYAKIHGHPLILIISDFDFLAGTLGSAEGEKICRSFELAAKDHLPVVVICCGGGARIQENLLALHQMAKTCAVIKKAQTSGVFYLSIFANPTMGGITASYASIARIIIAEESAKIGFAGEDVALKEPTSQELLDFRRAQSAEMKIKTRPKQIHRVIGRACIRDTIGSYLNRHHTDCHEINQLFVKHPYYIKPHWILENIAEADIVGNFRVVNILNEIEFPKVEENVEEIKEPQFKLRKNELAIRFEMPGMFWRGMKPGEILAKEKDHIKKDQPICVHEVCKVFSYVFAPCNGAIRRFLVNDGTYVRQDWGVCIIREHK